MNVYLSGAHRSGKSTLAPMLAKALGLEVVATTIAKTISESGLKFSDSHVAQKDPRKYLNLQFKVIENLRKELISSTNAVFDRAMIDTFAYAGYAFNNMNMSENTNAKLQEDFDVLFLRTERFVEEVSKHGITFVLQPTESVIFTPDIKSAAQDSQETVNWFLVQSAPEMPNHVVIPVDVSTPGDRLEFIMEYLKSKND